MAFRQDLDDFGSFYERSYQAAFRTAYGILGDYTTAADVTQDAFVNAFRMRSSFRGEAPARAWLIRIVVNTAISNRRKPRAQMLGSGHEDLSEGVGHGDRLDLEQALRVLSDRQRAVVVLRYYHGFDYDSIAAILGTSSGTVGSLLSRAVAALRKELTAVEPASGGFGDREEVRDVG
jgi:RNA polymerase sigma-70 factor, ECF subfamily